MMSVSLYARVSTDDKNQYPETQLYALKNFCQVAGLEIYREYVDHARAKDWKRRRSWSELQKDARQRKFKTVLVFRLDRAFRSVKECVNLVEDWYERGITFKSLSEDVIDTTTSSGRFILQIMAAIAELESSIIGERVAAGMARAKAQGKKLGRPAHKIETSEVIQAFEEVGTYSGAARLLSKKGRAVTPGFVQLRLKRAIIILPEQ
jgi:DNA invertase Pin-like site-specific DNA recombinase